MAKAAAGLADDLLTNLLLTARCPILMAPAMHTEMWEHPATVENVAVLRARGVQVLEPASGRLTGADSGPGRLPEPQEIFDAAFALATPSGHVSSLRGMRLLVTAGGTREPLDPVRFLGNRSSGRQGYALATVARERGGEVTLIAANTALPDPPGVEVVRVSTTAELYDATLAHARDVDAVVMAAAPADFRPVEVAPHKIKKTENGTTPTIRLAENPDILGALVAERASGGLKPAAVLVGFAAETGDERATPLAHGRAKLTRKGCDLLVVNEIGATRGFESEENAGVLLRADGSEREIPIGPKRSLAAVVWEEVVAWRAR
jgi:phosphopantothenoylcysteine decarboxylase/phosphopantothenate--cysteine ligase